MSDQKVGIEKLRESLFSALEGLSSGKIDVATAKAMSDIGQTIINSAKVEIEFQERTKRLVKSAFFASPEPLPNNALENPTPENGLIPTRHGIKEVNGNSTVHRMK